MKALRPVLLEAPSVLGLASNGVEHAPRAMIQAGLARALQAGYAGVVAPTTPYSGIRDITTHVLNASELHSYTHELAEAVSGCLASDAFPVVLGGDCSILLGCMLALRRRGRFGLLFLDGHMDFYAPHESPTGEAADMDLALVTGRGPALLTDFDNLHPLVDDTAVVAFGYRDEQEVAFANARTLQETGIQRLALATIRRQGIKSCLETAVATLTSSNLKGFWIHLDTDVLDDAVNPAVDYRMPGGLSFQELAEVLDTVLMSGMAVGMNVTIYNPVRDPTATTAHGLVHCLATGFSRALDVTTSAPPGGT